MQTKRILLASSAFAVLAAAQQAQAASDMYVSVLGGANFVQDQSRSFNSGSSSFSIDPDTGFVIGGVIGTKLTNWAKGLRVEMEASYRRSDMGGAWTTSSGSTGGFLDGNLSTFSIMANAWYDIDIGHKIVPYIGGGFGWARSHAEVGRVQTFYNSTGTTYDFEGSVDRQNTGFAWQLGLGFNYEVAPDVQVGLGYRYVVGPKFGDSNNDSGLVTFNSDSRVDNDNHAVQVNVTVGIN
jgi:opacity protein-like surface antigen